MEYVNTVSQSIKMKSSPESDSIAIKSRNEIENNLNWIGWMQWLVSALWFSFSAKNDVDVHSCKYFELQITVYSSLAFVFRSKVPFIDDNR